MEKNIFLQFTPIAKEQFSEAESLFQRTLFNDADMRQIRDALHYAFEQKKFAPKTIGEYYKTYWSWYIRAMYKKPLSLKEDVFITMFCKTFVTAHVMDLDPVGNFFQYIRIHAFEDEKARLFFEKTKNMLLREKYPLNPTITEAAILLPMFFREVRSSRLQRDTLAMTEYVSKVRNQLFYTVPTRYEIEKQDQEKILQSLTLSSNFFQKTTDIVPAFDIFLDELDEKNEYAEAVQDVIMYLSTEEGKKLTDVPLLGEKTRQQIREVDAQKQEEVFHRLAFPEDKGTEQETETPEETPFGAEPPIPTPKAASNAEKPTAMSYDQIKTMIDSRFEKDASGEYTNIEGVMVMLSGFAADQNDPQIAELNYFDEQRGKFMWNNAILGT